MSDSVEMKKNLFIKQAKRFNHNLFYIMERFFNTINIQINSFAIGTNFAFVNWGPLGA